MAVRLLEAVIESIDRVCLGNNASDFPNFQYY
jgi:hypothetical protein